MIDTSEELSHHIQRHILNVLRHTEYARFRDMRPPNTDSNLYSYHLTRLLKRGFVKKSPQGYTLSLNGLIYIDKISTSTDRPRPQAKIMTMSVILNEHDEALVRYKLSQPMINKLTFIAGMHHLEDVTIEQAALREIREKTGLEFTSIEHIGDCYMAVRHEGKIVVNSLMHIFFHRVYKDSIPLGPSLLWRHVRNLEDAAPATRYIAREFQGGVPKQVFFKEFIDDL